MDGQRFDDVIRTVSSRRSRRTAAALLAAALLAPFGFGGAPTADAAGCRAPGVRCARGGQCCSGRCNLRKRRCRACPPGEKFCAVEKTCISDDRCCLGEKPCNGGCIKVEECCGGCPVGQTCCQAPRFGVCVNLKSNEGHCGLCNRVCPTPTFPGQCQNGQCVPR